MKTHGIRLTVLVTALVLAWFSIAFAAGTVRIGMSNAMSGTYAELGQTALRGMKMAVADINAQGGLLGKTVEVVSADNSMSPATAASQVTNMIMQQHAVAIFGSVGSSVAVGQLKAAVGHKVPYFNDGANDVSMTTTLFSKYAFMLNPSTYMEPRAPADYIVKTLPKGKHITVGIIAANYSAGRDLANSFLNALKADGVSYTLVAKEYPAIGASSYSANIAALVVKNPQYIYSSLFGGDLLAFTQQARGYNLFKTSKVIGTFTRADLKALGTKSPAGSIGYGRAPFWAMQGLPGVKKFTQAYHSKYNEWPPQWSILAYNAVQVWADGVKKAGTFDGTQVADALSGGVTVPTILGSLTIRGCDHQAEMPEYVGVITNHVSKYGYPIWKDNLAALATKIMPTCSEVQTMRAKGN